MTAINPARARAWRESLGYTQEGLSRALGVSRRQVAAMESGVRPDGKTIRAVDWRRYALLCAGLTHMQGKPVEQWDWDAG